MRFKIIDAIADDLKPVVCLARVDVIYGCIERMTPVPTSRCPISDMKEQFCSG